MSAALSEMSIAGGIMILGVVLLRSICLNRLPKAAFVMMWQIVLIRLLLPLSFEIPVLPVREAVAVIPIFSQGPNGGRWTGALPTRIFVIIF